MSSIWLLVSVGGPILLAGAVGYMIVRNWRDAQREDELLREKSGREEEFRERNETFI